MFQSCLCDNQPCLALQLHYADSPGNQINTNLKTMQLAVEQSVVESGCNFPHKFAPFISFENTERFHTLIGVLAYILEQGTSHAGCQPVLKCRARKGQFPFPNKQKSDTTYVVRPTCLKNTT